MQGKFVKFFGIFGLSAMIAGGAQALTTINAEGFDASGDAKGQSAGTYANFDFSWSTVTFSGFVKFTIDTTSNLYITGYSGPTNAEYSGFMLLEEGAAHMTTDFTVCGGTDVLDEVRGTCNLITNQTNPSLTSYRPDLSTPYTTLSAGTYFLGMYENGDPSSGSASFQVSEGAYVAPVPLPAGGALLIGALGGLAALRRRKKAA